MKLTILKTSAVLLLWCIALQANGQQLLIQNFASAGGDVSNGGAQRLISVIGQPMAYSSSVGSEIKAGFLQVASKVIVDTQPPVIGYATPTKEITQGATSKFAATITDNIQLSSKKIYYKPITSPASSFQNAEMTLDPDGKYSATVQTTWYDNMGMEYYFTAVDGASNTARSPAAGSYYSYLTISADSKIPASAFTAGTKTENYRIIAMPYSSDNGDAISTVFGTTSNLKPHKSDKTVWRLAGYDATNKKFVEYPDLSNFKRGEGYWFLVKDITTITLGSKTTLPNNRNNLYKITLKPGWNMIGNPYPVAIKWSDVQNFVGNEAAKTVALNIYQGGYSTSSDLAPFQGGFVNNTSSTDLVVTIPFVGQTAAGGRRSQEPESNISADVWQVNLDMYQGNTFNKLGRFGMMPKHELTSDELAYNPPAFENAPEVNFEMKGQSLKKLCKVIVATSKENTWKFAAAGEAGEAAQIKWNEDLGNGSEPLFLLDEQNLKLTDMRESNSYSFTLAADHRFSIFYGLAAEKIAPQKVMIGAPYPNPAIDRTATFLLGLPESTDSFDVGFQIVNGNGAIYSTDQKSLAAGIHSLVWQADDKAAAGLYYYRIQVRSAKGVEVTTGKIVLP
ncbi:MAG: hypothetical protein ACKVOQ_19485 [Cyclobacteriaceae bacterium]